MLSRVAEAIYWMSRYIERAENVARFISVNLNLHLDMAGGENQWLPLVVTAGDEKPFAARYNSASKRDVLHFLTFDRENPNSILSSARAARENARSVREVISGEMWEHINRSYLALKDSDASQAAIENTAAFYEQIRVSGQQFMGITDATMTHGEAWHFCRMGRLIERADKTSRILDVKYYLLLPSAEDVGSTMDDSQWSALLQSASGLEMYRQRHGLISPANVVQFLLLDREFPRAVLFCLTKANESLHAVSGAALGGFSNAPERILGQLRNELAYMCAEDIIERGLHEYVDDLQDRLNLVGEAIFETFFDLRPMGAMTFSRI